MIRRYPEILAQGLSPRGRGKRVLSSEHGHLERSIPAWAGETIGYELSAKYAEVYPRVGGGNLPSNNCGGSVTGLSPRGRGKRGSTAPPKKSPRSIPAWAGETLCARDLDALREVYPRVGGGNPILDNNI